MLIDNYNKFIKNKLKEIYDKNQFRKLKTFRRYKRSILTGKKGKLISFACNDYLSLSTDTRLINASSKAVEKYGTGSGASRLITGNNPLYKELENQLCDIKKTEACSVFGSGFLANLGVISALSGLNDLILIDSLSHASSFLGTKLTNSKVIKFNHNCMEDLEEKLIKYRTNFQKCIILTEGIFSMDGDIAPQDKISFLKEKYNATFILDDAHGMGTVGDGTGSSSLFDKRKINIDVYIGTLSKSLGGYGGFVCGNKDLIDFLVNRCRTQIYTTGLPPAVLASSIKALTIIRKNPKLVKKPLENARYFCEKVNLKNPSSPIVPIILNDEKKVMRASKLLEENGYLVGSIRPPTVPINTSRLRLAFNSSHTKSNIKDLANIISSFL